VRVSACFRAHGLRPARQGQKGALGDGMIEGCKLPRLRGGLKNGAQRPVEGSA
jgi:hypothetical protein